MCLSPAGEVLILLFFFERVCSETSDMKMCIHESARTHWYACKIRSQVEVWQKFYKDFIPIYSVYTNWRVITQLHIVFFCALCVVVHMKWCMFHHGHRPVCTWAIVRWVCGSLHQNLVHAWRTRWCLVCIVCVSGFLVLWLAYTTSS
jgi:hypothetical protein